jgi:hypothetical protein
MDAFLDHLRKFDGTIILFGGEPTLYQERLDLIFADDEIRPKIKSISTNLLILNDHLISLYHKIPHMATSWNPHRFNAVQYDAWKENLKWLGSEGLSAAVLVTMTGDLFEYGPEKFVEMIQSWDPDGAIAIRFEYLVADNLTPKYYEEADQWLCDVYKAWKGKIPMDTTIGHICYFDCGETYRLSPNGILARGCPNYRTPSVPTECYSCERSAICKPCMLQEHCMWPKNFVKLIEEEGQEKWHSKSTHLI